MLPENWSSKQRRALRLKSASYQLVEGVLFKKNYDGVLLRCLEKEDAKKVMSELHDGPAGDIIQSTLQPTKSLEPVTIGLHSSRMHMHMSGNVIFAKGVVEDNLKQQHP